MAYAYNHYRQRLGPAWGTQQMEFPPPPPPSFQPQPNWGGSDFYNAHAANNPDPSLYENAWGNVRQHSGSSLENGNGVGKNEAKHWHRRAYGGFSDINTLFPADIGHAAAYEAYRSWKSNSDLYEPLSGDIERQREGLVGLAIAEASRLLQFTNRSIDNQARMAASDAAAATASVLFYRHRDREDEGYGRSRSRTRRGSVGSYDDPFASDLLAPRGHHRSHSRQRSHSREPMMYPQHLGSTAPMPISGAGNSYGMGTPYPNGAQLPPTGSAYSSSAVGVPMAGNQSYGSLPGQGYGSVPGQGYGSVPGQAYGSLPGQGYGSLHANYNSAVAMPMTQSYSVPMGTRQRSTSISVPGYYAGQRHVQYATPVQYVQAPYRTVQPQVIVAGSGHRSHKRHHHHSKKKRSRSIY